MMLALAYDAAVRREELCSLQTDDLDPAHRTRFDPTRALATPRSVKALIGPVPGVIVADIWAKLLWAGLHLEPPDLVPSARAGYCYPVELLRALAVTWLFSGLRSG